MPPTRLTASHHASTTSILSLSYTKLLLYFLSHNMVKLQIRPCWTIFSVKGIEYGNIYRWKVYTSILQVNKCNISIDGMHICSFTTRVQLKPVSTWDPLVLIWLLFHMFQELQIDQYYHKWYDGQGPSSATEQQIIKLNICLNLIIRRRKIGL